MSDGFRTERAHRDALERGYRLYDGVMQSVTSEGDGRSWRATSASLKVLERILAERRRAQPIALAFLGTTSAGKSSLLNAMIGAEVLPTDVDELSAGAVHVRAPWPGEPCAVTVKDVTISHRSLSSVELWLKSYFRMLRVEQTSAQPGDAVEMTLRVPMAHVAELCGAPAEEIELIDLPGLRTADDDESRGFIARKLPGSVPILILDSRQLFAREQISGLLELLGEGEELCVLLNKIDAHASTDRALDEVIITQRALLTEALGGRGFQLIPVSGLFLRESLWARDLAVSVLRGGSPSPEDRERLNELCRDTSRALRQPRGQALPIAQEARPALRALERALDDDDGRLSLDGLHTLSACLWQLGGGPELREVLHARVQAARAARSSLTRAQQDVISALQRLNKAPKIEDAQALDAQVSALLSVFRRMIEADGVVHPREVELAAALTDEFLQRFHMCTWDEHHADTPRELDGAITGALLLPLGQLHERFPNSAQRAWLIHALQLLAVADWRMDPREEALTQQAIHGLTSPLEHRARDMADGMLEGVEQVLGSAFKLSSGWLTSLRESVKK